MAQHFLLAAKARTIGLQKVLGLSDDDARMFFAEMRWGDKTQQMCLHCGVADSHRYVPLQKRWRCRHCTRITPAGDHFPAVPRPLAVSPVYAVPRDNVRFGKRERSSPGLLA